MNALEKAAAQSRMAPVGGKSASTTAERATLVAKLKGFDQTALVALVEEQKLPGATSKWTIEQLRDVVNTMEGGGKEEAEQAPEQAPLSFVLAYKPDGSSVEVSAGMSPEEWDAWTPPDEHEAVMVGSAGELAEVPTEVLLAVFNQAKGSKVKKFANPDTAREQAFAALGLILDKSNTTAASAATKEAKAKTPKEPKAPKPPAEPKLINREPKAKEQIKPVGAGTKIDTLIQLLASKEGTTIEEIEEKLSASGKPVKATAWLGYDLNSVTGYGVRQDAETKRLFIVYPKGMTAPLPTKEKKAPTPPTPKAAKAEALAAAAPAKKGAAAAPAAPAAPAATTGPSFAEKMAAAKAAKAAAAAPAPAAKKAPAPAKKK